MGRLLRGIQPIDNTFQVIKPYNILHGEQYLNHLDRQGSIVEEPEEEEDKDEGEDEEEDNEDNALARVWFECRSKKAVIQNSEGTTIYSLSRARKMKRHFHFNCQISLDPTVHDEWRQKPPSLICVTSRVRCCERHVQPREVQPSQRSRTKTLQIKYCRAWSKCTGRVRMTETMTQHPIQADQHNKDPLRLSRINKINQRSSTRLYIPKHDPISLIRSNDKGHMIDI